MSHIAIAEHSDRFPQELIQRTALLFVGSDIAELAEQFRLYRPARLHLHLGYDMPPEGILANIDGALVFEIEQRERLEQLRFLCRERRRSGHIRTVIGYSRSLDVRLAAMVEGAGARFVPLLGERR